MSLVLRSSHFFRSLTSISRKITLTATTQANFSLLPATSACTSHVSPFLFTQSFVTHVNVAPLSNSTPIEISIKKLDDEARRLGRVSASEIKIILSSLNRSNSPTSTQALMLIRCCGSLLPEETPTSRSQIVQNLWQTFEKLNISLDVSHYNALLRVYLENEHTFSPTDFLAQMEAKGIEPNRVTYQRLVAKYCQDGNIEGATKILEFMRDKNFPISEGVFNALIYGHSQNNDMTSAESILGLMTQAGIEPTAQTYCTLMSGFAKQGDMESLRRVLASCEHSLVNSDYLDVIHALAVNGHEQYIEEIIAKIQPGVGYSADAANHIFHLVNKGQIETAYRVVKTLARSVNINGEQLPVGGFLIRHMVRINQPVDKVLEVCQRLTDENLHPNAFNLAVQIAVETAPLDTLVTLLREFKTRGGEIRSHFFWPALVREGKANNTAEVLRILKVAESEFSVGSNQETTREYVLPYLSPSNQVSQEVFAQLREVGVSLGTITCAYVNHMLSQHQLKEAARVATAFRARYAKAQVRKVLIPAYLRTQDLSSLVTVVKAVSENWEVRGEAAEARVDSAEPKEEGAEEEPVAEGGPSMDSQFPGNVLIDIFSATRRQENFVPHLEQLLNEFVKQGIPISRFASEFIQNGLQSSMTSNISEALSTLTSEELNTKFLQYVPSLFLPRNQKMNEEYTLQNIKKLDSQGENTNGLKRSLFTYYIREKEFDKAKEYLKVLEDDPNFTVAPGIYILMLNLSADLDNLEATTHYLRVLGEKFPGDKMDASKVLKVAYLLLKHGKEAEMLDFLRENGRTEPSTDSEFPSNAAAWRLLNLAAETTNPETTKKVFELLKSHNFITPSNVILGSLIKAHILKDDFTGALETFESCVTQYRATPWKSELLRHFIQSEDAASLQRITDLSTTIHGEINSLYDLMLCFLDNGRLRQARKILETPGMRLRSERLSQALDYYVSSGTPEKVENLLKVTQDLPNFDRASIYQTLLELYAASDDVEKALGLWTQMQEDNDTPSEAFLVGLAALLKKNGKPVPFSVPAGSAKPTSGSAAKSSPRPTDPSHLSVNAKLKTCIRDGHPQEAFKIYQTNKPNLSIVSRIELIPHLLTHGLKSEAAQVIADLTREDLEQLRQARILRTSLAAYSCHELGLLAPKLSDSLRRQSAFSTHQMRAAVLEGSISNYLASLSTALAEAGGSQQKIGELVQQLPMSGLLVALQANPELLPEVMELVNKFAAAGFNQPMQALFNYYYINGLNSEAEQIFEKHLKDCGRNLRFRTILNHLSRTRDLSAGESLLDLTRRMPDNSSLCDAYAGLINVAVKTEQLAPAIDLLSRAVADAATARVNKTLVDKLQALASKQGETVPLSLMSKIVFAEKNQEQKNSSSSSSSDSDEEAAEVERK